MATHSSVLAWRIPGMAEPGRLPSMGSHRVGHDRSDLAAAAMCKCSNSYTNSCILSICNFSHSSAYVLFHHSLMNISLMTIGGFPGGSVVKNLPPNVGAVGLIPGLGRSPGEGNGNPLQYSCPGNPMDRGAWRVTVHGIAKVLDTSE